MQQSRKTVIPARASRYTTTQEPASRLEPQARRQGCSLTSYFLLGMGMMLVLYLIGTFFIVPFLQGLSDHWQYGQDHISQLDTTIAGTPYRFIAEDMHGKLIIIGLDRANPSQARLYIAPQTLDADNLVVKLSIQDVNGDGKPDLVLAVQGQTSEVVLFGSTGGFSWTEPK